MLFINHKLIEFLLHEAFNIFAEVTEYNGPK